MKHTKNIQRILKTARKQDQVTYKGRPVKKGDSKSQKFWDTYAADSKRL